MKLTKALLAILILAVMMLNTSCDKEKIDERPDLPPVESLEMDFSIFQEYGLDKDMQKDLEKGIVSTEVNFGHAYLNVLFWNAFTTGTLYIPFTAYKVALQQTPEYIGDSAWEWQYNIDLLQLTYTVTLTAKRIDNETFSMEMNIAVSSMPAIKFTYFDGVCHYNHTHAEWNLYKNNEGSSVKVLEVVWNKDFVAGDASLEYTYVEPGQAETNSFILWKYVPGTDYDARYTISLSTGIINIEWDTTTNAGRVMDPVYFEDTDWHCWNDLFQDITCPE